jgi:antitoxin MazE
MMEKVERKITKIGNSLGVTIPNDFLEMANISLGDEVVVDYVDNKITLKKSEKIQKPEGLSDNFFEVLDKTMKNYKKTIEGLVER